MMLGETLGHRGDDCVFGKDEWERLLGVRSRFPKEKPWGAGGPATKAQPRGQAEKRWPKPSGTLVDPMAREPSGYFMHMRTRRRLHDDADGDAATASC